MTFVQDQLRPTSRQRHPARSTARMVSPMVCAPSGVAQAIVRHWPRTKAEDIEDPDEQAACHPEQLAQSAIVRIAPGHDHRPDHGQAAGHGEDAGEELMRRPGHPAARHENRHARGERRPDHERVGQRRRTAGGL